MTSPDLNLIENLLSIFKRHMYENRISIFKQRRTVEELTKSMDEKPVKFIEY